MAVITFNYNLCCVFICSEVLNYIRTAPVVLELPEGTPVQLSMSSTYRPVRIGRAPRKKIPQRIKFQICLPFGNIVHQLQNN